MDNKYNHNDLEDHVNKIIREINVHRNFVFEMYTFKDPGIRSTTNFLNTLTKLDKLLIVIQKDFRRLLLDKHCIDINEIDFVFRCINEIGEILTNNVFRFKALHNKYYKEDGVSKYSFFINRSINELFNKLVSDSSILGSRMRSCLFLLSKRP